MPFPAAGFACGPSLSASALVLPLAIEVVLVGTTLGCFAALPKAQALGAKIVLWSGSIIAGLLALGLGGLLVLVGVMMWS